MANPVRQRINHNSGLMNWDVLAPNQWRSFMPQWGFRQEQDQKYWEGCFWRKDTLKKQIE